MCDTCEGCFSKEEKNKLIGMGWTKKQIDFAEHSVIEDKIKELIR